MIWQAQCYPTNVDDLKPVLELVARLGADHVNLQPNVRPQRIEDCIPLIEGWRRLADQAGVAVHVETHRDRMTTDLFFTLQLLDCFPDLRLTADVSHYLVGREFAWPVDEVNHAMIHRILDNSWGIHGRIASREQVQISLGFPQHRGWVELFMGWWEYAIRSWRKRAGPDAVLTFLCELGPPPYAITGPDGAELSDRWQDALVMKDMVRALWQRIARRGCARHQATARDVSTRSVIVEPVIGCTISRKPSCLISSTRNFPRPSFSALSAFWLQSRVTSAAAVAC